MSDYVPPGLVSKEIIAADKDTVTIREVWDPRVQGCPMVFFDRSVWPWVKRTDVVEAVHQYKMPRQAEQRAKSDD